MDKTTFKLFDIILILLVSAAIAVISVVVYKGDHRPGVVTVRSDDGVNLYPLDQDRILEVKGPLGITVVEIKNAHVRVISSPCRDKLCILKGDLVKNGDWTACMPNRFFIKIEGKNEEAPDEISY